MKIEFNTERDNKKSSSIFANKKALIKIIILFVVIFIIPAILLYFNPDLLKSFNSFENFKLFLKENQSNSYFIYVVLQIIFVVITFLPQQFMQFAAGFFFGFGITLLLSIIGMVIGSIISYYLAKFLGSEFVIGLVGDSNYFKYKNMLDHKRGKLFIALVYIIPGFPKDLFAYIAGIARINIFSFLIISTLARLPGVIVSILFGELLLKSNYLLLIIVGVIFVTLLIIGFINKDKIFKKIFK